MLVVSMADFASNSEYKSAPCRIIDNGVEIGTFFPKKAKAFGGFFKNVFKRKERPFESSLKVGKGKRPDAPLKGMMECDFLDKIQLTPETLFSDIDDLSKLNKLSTKYS